MSYSCEKSFSREILVLTIEKFPSFELPRRMIVIQKIFSCFICQVVAYRRLKTEEISKF